MAESLFPPFLYPAILLTINLSGALISGYFVYLDRHPPTPQSCPTFARPVCLELRFTPYYACLGIPNVYLAFAYFTLCLLFSLLFLAGGVFGKLISALFPSILSLSIVASLFSLLMAYFLIFHLRKPCFVCFTLTVLSVLNTILLGVGL